MTAGRPRVSVDGLRDAVQRRSAATPIRELADEIGVAFSALARFARGETKTLSRKNYDKLSTWFYRGGASGPPANSGAASDEEVAAAIAVLRTVVHDDSKAASVRERRRKKIIKQIIDPL